METTSKQNFGGQTKSSMVYLKVAYNFLESVQTSYQSEGLGCARIFSSFLESASELVIGKP